MKGTDIFVRVLQRRCDHVGDMEWVSHVCHEQPYVTKTRCRQVPFLRHPSAGLVDAGDRASPTCVYRRPVLFN